MGAAILVVTIGLAMIGAGTRYRRTVLGTLGIIFGGVIVFIGVGMAAIASAE